MKALRRMAISTSAIILFGSSVSAQWKPVGSLLNVPVIQSCSETGLSVAVSNTDGLFLCQSRAEQVDAQVKDASHFYIVREFGLFTLRSTSGKLADCWAAHQLAEAPNGVYYVKQWIKHWRNFGGTRPNIGTPAERIANVRACCACGI